MSDPVTVQPEPTPNPMSVKFTVNRVVNPEKRGKTFSKKADCAGFPLFEKLFDACGEGIASVFTVNRFFTVTSNGKWSLQELVGKVVPLVEKHFAA